MLNQVVLVGRLTETPIVEPNRTSNIIHLCIPRPYKNSEGIYENDFIDCILSGGILNNASEYCKKGDIVGVKGRLESRDDKIVVMCEKLTFLSSHSSEN